MRTLGIQIDGPFLLGAIMEGGRNTLEIRALRLASLADPQNVKELYMPSFSGRTVASIPSKNLIVRHLSINIPKSRHLGEALAFQSEGSGPFKPEEVMVTPYVQDQKGSAIEAALFIVSRSSIRELLSELEKLNLDPDRLSTSEQALVHYIQWKEPTLDEVFLIHLGFKEWNCLWMEKGRLKKSHSLLGGNEALLSALWEDRKKTLLQKEVDGVAKQIDLLQLKSHLNPNLSKKLGEMRMELTKAIFSFHRESGNKPYFFTGSTDTFAHYAQFLAENFKETAAFELDIKISKEELKYAIAIGLGVEQSSKNPLQLRREEFFPRKNWAQSGLYALGLLTASLVLSLFLSVAGQKIFSARKVARGEELYAILEKSDPELKEKLFASEKKNVFRQWAETVDLYSEEYPFLSKAPKVAELLDWVRKHPVLQNLKREGSPILIQDLSYQLLQCPQIGKLEEPYLAKVEIEFETDSPMSARKFHQALLKGDEWVDARQEIGWESLSANRYRASFLLKNRSPYVP